ncbi:MAG: hypothetical protein M0D53_12715 [Flavobacterium sp. JAD_PAG50586_2]|nr:MAG: hypothetical protein M0D53_12715 [Flavobacterium sp. JAD_PAG50586_2]
MEEIKAFLNDFLEAEVQAIKSRDIADLNDYNSKLDYMNSFVIDSVKNQFGMTPKHTLDSPQYYEKMKGAGNPDKRFVFRIDKFEQNERVIYKALVSERDPNGLMIYADCFIIEKRNSSKIIAKFFFLTRNGILMPVMKHS